MPFYSDELVEEVRSRSDIVDVVGSYVHLTKRGGTYFGLCPFHNEKTPSFSVTPQKQIYYCFGCGAGGDVFRFLMNYENMSFPEAMQMLADRAGVELPKQEMTNEQRQRADKRSRLLDIHKEAATFYYMMLRNEQGKPGMDYFRKRELTDETMQKFGLGYTGRHSNGLYQYLRKKGYSDEDLADSGLVTIDERRGAHDKFWNRVMFPIMDVNQKVIAFGGRVMGDGEPKYLNSPETMIFNKSRTLFGLHLAKRTKRPQIILCEGYLDVISMHQAGFDNAVASLGTALTEGHANILRRYTKDVYLSYDSDGAGVKAALRAIPILKEAGITCKIINMQPHKDPDEFIKALGTEEYQKRIDQAENSFMFRVRMLERDYDLKDPESNTLFFREVAAMLLEFDEELERNNYVQAVASHYQRTYDSIYQLMVHTASREGITGANRQSSRSGNEEQRQSRTPELDPVTALPRQTVRRKGNTKEEGMRQSQRLLLTWICEDPEVFQAAKRYIVPEDFEPGIMQKTAELVWQQMAGGGVNPGRIMGSFSMDDEETQKEVARIFNASVGEITKKEDRQKALKETLIRIKNASLDRMTRLNQSTDPNILMKIIQAKKQLQEMEKLSLQNL